MALDPSTEFPGKITAPDANYPYGSARDITVPGDGTGTPWLAVLVNDIFGFQQALLTEADGIVPSGSPDTVLASDYLNAVNIIKARLTNTQKIVGRNFADTLYRDLIGLNTSDVIELGNAVNDIYVAARLGVGVIPTAPVHVKTSVGYDGMFTETTGGGVNSGAQYLLQADDLSARQGILRYNSGSGTQVIGGGLDLILANLSTTAGADVVIAVNGGDASEHSLTLSRVAGVVSTTSTVESTATNTGALVLVGGAGVAKSVFIGEALVVGAPTGGSKGTGTGNFTGLFVNGAAIGDLIASNNLSDVASASTSRTNLGINNWTKHPTVHTGVSSGTSIAWTAIPSGVTNIKIVYADHSWNGGADIALRLGDSGGFEATGYSGRASKADIGTDWSTQAIISKALVAGDASNGEIHIVNITGNQWGINATGLTETGQFFIAGGAKSTSGVMDRVQIISEDGTSTFDGNGNYALYYQ